MLELLELIFSFFDLIFGLLDVIQVVVDLQPPTERLRDGRVPEIGTYALAVRFRNLYATDLLSRRIVSGLM